MNSVELPVRKIIWVNLLFFLITTMAALVGGGFYLYARGLATDELFLTLFYVIATGLSITAGYHRLFAHATYKSHPAIRFLFLFFGAAAFEQSALDWATQHRDHHRYVDTNRDPYSIRKGFFYAHLGWLIFWKHHLNYENVKDLQRDPLVMHQSRYYLLWAATSGIVLPVLIGGCFGHALGAFLFAVCARLTLVYHATFCINSICHMFGNSTYDIHASAKDHWVVALITFGEGYHNFHHRFPGDYRNGVRWYHWDPSKWVISILNGLGLAQDLKRVSEFRILDARIAAQEQRICEKIQKDFQETIIGRSMENVKKQYHSLRDRLREWEAASNTYRIILKDRFSGPAEDLRRRLKVMQAAQQRFEVEYKQWLYYLRFDLSVTV